MDPTAADNQYPITKGPRTKRQRLSAVLGKCSDGGGFASSYASSSTSGNCNSDDHDVMSEITTEEHDTANCLILLARGIKKLPEYSRYDCKTCNKTFHSFQALGGHRASHKKPKPAPSPDPNEIHIINKKVAAPAVVSKVHECSICGSEFPSGQALGGHMRRHRVPPAANSSSGGAQPKQRNVLSLDLNLPATGDDEDNIATTSFHRVTPALVDCLY